MGPWSNPSVADFQAQFFRDFPYGTDINTTVTDQDIVNAFVCTNVNINQALFQNQGTYTLGYLLLSAHYLVTNLRASSQGINGQYNFLQQGKGAGPVNESFAIPQRILDNPYFSMLTKTNYGAQYLQLLLPQLSCERRRHHNRHQGTREADQSSQGSCA
jgi:hypothetical protein